MGRFILIDVAVALALSFLWYGWFVRYNRRRAAGVLQWVQAACLGKGRIADLRWQQLAAEGHSASILALV